MSGKSTSFEVQVLKDKNWVVETISTDEAQAKEFADNLLQTTNHSAVRVVRDFQRIDGLHTETVIHEKTASEKDDKDLSLAAISEAPTCVGIDEFYALNARLTIGRLLRKYLDDVQITQTELLHNAAEMKRLGDKDRLLFSAIDKVSTLQARATGEDAKVRRDFLANSWEAALTRARQAAPKKAPAKSSLGELVAAAPGEGDEKRFQCLVLVALRLLESRAWFGKLEILLDWAAEEAVAGESGGLAMSLIDGIVADIVVSAQVIQDLLGFQPNLGAALAHICDLAAGQAEAAKFAPAWFGDFNRLFAAGKLADSQQVLLSRVVRETRSANPLSRNEPAQEFEAFNSLLVRIVSRDGLVGGPAMAEALFQRYVRFFNGGGTPGQAIEAILTALGDTCRKIQFLLEFAASPSGVALGKKPVDMLVAMVRGAKHIDGWVPVRGVLPRDRMGALTSANRALLSARVLTPELRTELGDAADAVMVRYLEDEGVIEKIDKPEDPLALRAIRLVKFCGSGVLIEGKSLAMARSRVIGHLKQAQFEEKFLASVPDPVQAEKHLREFHRLLVESGFR